MKKKSVLFQLMVLLVIIVVVASWYFFLKNETLKGVVTREGDKEILITIDRSEERFSHYSPENPPLLSVSSRNSYIDFSQYKIGQTVIIEYDGTIKESFPGQIEAKKIKLKE